jgi:hypothetical protein
MPAAAWAPTLSDVARHIPTRTRDTQTPGSDAMLGTFTPETTPTDEQAQEFIDQSVQWVVGNCGQLPQNLTSTDDLWINARTAAEWRAAADIEIAFPMNRDPDVRLFQVMDQRAKDALATVRAAMQGEGVGQVDLVPYWAMPPQIPPGTLSVRFVDGEGWTYLRDNWWGAGGVNWL